MKDGRGLEGNRVGEDGSNRDGLLVAKERWEENTGLESNVDESLSKVDWTWYIRYVPQGYGETISIDEFAKRLDASRGFIHHLIDKKGLIVIRAGSAMLWAKQIERKRKVVRGLEEVHREIDDPELAWGFLTREWLFEDELGRPIELMAQGKVTKAIEAARVFSEQLSRFRLE